MHILLLLASRIVPSELRSAWLSEWRAEIAHFHGSNSRLMLHLLGAFPDALAVLRQELTIGALLEDAAYAARALRKNHRFLIPAVSILAVSLAAATLVFQTVDDVLLRPLPYPNPEELVMLRAENGGFGVEDGKPSPGDVLAWRERSRAFDGIAAWQTTAMDVESNATVEKVTAGRVTTDFFHVLGRTARLGRTFSEQEVARQDDVVVISHALWTQQFAGARDVIGKTLVVDDVPKTVIGVMPPDFAFPSNDVTCWIPWSFAISYAHRPSGIPHDFRFLNTIARMKGGVELGAAEEELRAISAALAREHPDTNEGWSVRLSSLREELTGAAAPSLRILTLAVLFVVLIAAVNVGNLMFARSIGRRREIAVASAIGASGQRLANYLMLESIIISVLAAVAGWGIAAAGDRALMLVAPAEIARLLTPGLGARSVFFITFVALAIGTVTGAVISSVATPSKVVQTLRDSAPSMSISRKQRRVLDLLVIAEIAGAMVLLVGAGLMLRTFANLMRADVGLSTDGLIVTRVLLDPNRFPEGADRTAYFARLVPQLRAIPGVENVALTTGLPLNDMNFGPTRPYWREGETPPKGGGRKVRLQMISPDYFATTGTPLLTGRPFTERDDSNAAPVAILNETLARQLWPNERAVGKRIILDYLARGPYPYEVVGVMRDARSESLRDDAEPEIRLPHAQVPYNRVNVVIRASKQLDPRSLFGAIREAARRVDPTEPVHSVLLMSDLVRSATARERFTFAVLAAFSVLALVVATAGLYAVAAASVARRTSELSIRAAIGASQHDLLSMILREGARLVVAGIAAGVVLAFALSETLRALLFGVAPFDATTYAAVAALLLCASVLGILSPARRAARTNAAALLRT